MIYIHCAHLIYNYQIVRYICMYMGLRRKYRDFKFGSDLSLYLDSLHQATTYITSSVANQALRHKADARVYVYMYRCTWYVNILGRYMYTPNVSWLRVGASLCAPPRRGVVRAATSRSRRAGCCVTLRSHAIGIDPPLRDTAGYTA